MALKDVLPKAVEQIKKFASFLRILKPNMAVIVIFFFFFVAGIVVLVMTMESSCTFDPMKGTSTCMSKTITGLSFFQMSFLVATACYIMSCVLVSLYRRFFVKTYF